MSTCLPTSNASGWSGPASKTPAAPAAAPATPPTCAAAAPAALSAAFRSACTPIGKRPALPSWLTSAWGAEGLPFMQRRFNDLLGVPCTYKHTRTHARTHTRVLMAIRCCKQAAVSCGEACQTRTRKASMALHTLVLFCRFSFCVKSLGTFALTSGCETTCVHPVPQDPSHGHKTTSQGTSDK